MRKYALVILDKFDKIQDRIDLNYVTNPTGNGFKLKLSTISSDVEDLVTKVVQDKGKTTFIINQNQNSYQKAFILAQWIQKYLKPEYQMALEYDDGVSVKYREGRVTELAKTEKDEFYVLPQNFEFTHTTPYFIRQENTITIQTSAIGKKYPYKYPYQYGKLIFENNEINNPYISDIPLIVTINGAISNPTIDLLNDKGERYSRVQFDNMILNENEQLVINSTQRKIYKISNGTEIDYTPEVNPQYDTFLRAIEGKSTININTIDAGNGFKLTGSWRQYIL